MRGRSLLAGVVVAAVLGAAPARAQVLTVDGTTVTLGGVQTYTDVRVINGGRIVVPPFDGVDRVNTGNLVLRAPSILVDATSSIVATGSGYQTVRCGNGGGPAADSGGRGGCALFDSGGGGGHFGTGGRGTKDCFVYGSAVLCEFPQEWEEDCGNSLNAGGTACTSVTDCRNLDGVPTGAGQPYRHSIYDVEFGAAGGDKGCRDGDGFGAQPNVAGPGGGRIVLAGLSAAADGLVDIRGQVRADGTPGCGTGNDSAGGGAGGTLLIVGDRVVVGANAVISAAGGLGGDTRGAAGGRPDCPLPAQQGGTCDDCGGGGGGGLVAVLSRTSTLAPTARFDVRGALGGVCTICSGEAGGGAGELQLDGAYVGELCDGYDNDFDGTVDEGLPALSCGLPSCVAGVPQQCPTAPSCIGPVTDTRPRFAVVVDSSGSMLTDLAGLPTFGDGTAGHLGIDADGDGVQGNDSRLFRAKDALTRFVSAYTEIDFALARYHQDVGTDRSCQLAHWFECQDMCCCYDDPRDNTAPLAVPACTLDGGASGMVTVNMVSPAGEQCINYAGSCGTPRRGADVLVGFGRPRQQLLRWLDQAETSFSADTTPGNACNFAGGGDCELRGTGPTPLAGSLEAMYDYLQPIVACDAARACRTYGVILLTDGAESCRGDPVAAAQALWDTLGVRTFVVGFSVLPSEEARLDAIARAGSGGVSDAYLAADESELVNALATIVAGSIVTESCNGLDDDCDGFTDEGFVRYCNLPSHPAQDLCTDPGEFLCNGIDDNCDGRTDEGLVNACGGCGTLLELCNLIDDDCDGSTDEGGVCIPGCIPSPEVCDNADNDCDGSTDEGVTRPCGTGIGQCSPGTQTCSAGLWGPCLGGTAATAELCDDLDNDCDGRTDGFTRPCGTDEGVCTLGAELCTGGAWAGTCVGAYNGGTEVCNLLDDDCDGSTDEGDPGGGGECGGSVGECLPGVRHCIGGMLVCSGGSEPVPELCDLLDNDCDGFTDEGNPGGGGGCYTGPAGTEGVGVCEGGVERCQAGTIACDGEVLPGPEDCNLLDDDCDTATDEGLATGGTCGSDEGECATGMEDCVAGAWVCSGEIGPTTESCDLLDNDCDGATDEGNPGGGEPCGWSADPATWDTGICEPGLSDCVAGSLDCIGVIGPDTEVCNGLDDDCNGLTDDGLGVGDPCGLDEGDCEAGTYACVDGRTECVGGRGPTDEICDCNDNDCDAETDEGDPCGGGAACVEAGAEVCLCAEPCNPDIEFPCPVGYECVAGLVAEDPLATFCVPESDECGAETCNACERCDPATTTCVPDVVCPECRECNPVSGRCDPICARLSCTVPLVCVCDECLTPDCYTTGFECEAGEDCEPDPATGRGRCVPNDCTVVSCDPPQFCRDDEGCSPTTPDACCHDPCELIDACPAGQLCYDGACVDDPHLCSPACPAGQVCVDGACVDDTCGDVECAWPLECDPETGDCEEPPCWDLTCPDGYECRNGTCFELGRPADDEDGGDDDGTTDDAAGSRVIATGAGGCACRTSGGSSPGGALGLLGLVGLGLLLRARRRAARRTPAPAERG